MFHYPLLQISYQTGNSWVCKVSKSSWPKHKLSKEALYYIGNYCSVQQDYGFFSHLHTRALDESCIFSAKNGIGSHQDKAKKPFPNKTKLLSLTEPYYGGNKPKCIF